MTLRITTQGMKVAQASVGPQINANALATVPLVNMANLGINVLGTWVGTINFEVTFDGATWQPLSLPPYADAGGTQTGAVSSISSTSTTNKTGFWAIPLPSITPGGAAGAVPPIAARARMSAYTSGTAQVTVATSDDNTYLTAQYTPEQLWVNTQSASNTSVTAASPSAASHAFSLTYLSVDYSVASTATGGTKLIVLDGATQLAQFSVPQTALTQQVITLPSGGIRAGIGNQIIVQIPAAGAGCVANVNAGFAPT